MCNCGRRKNQVVTSAQLQVDAAQDQAAQADQAAALQEVRTLAMQTATQAEQYLASAVKAVGNSRS